MNKLENSMYLTAATKVSEGVFVRVSGWAERWYDEEGNIHRDNGLPAVLQPNGYEGYYIHGVFQYKKWKGER